MAPYLLLKGLLTWIPGVYTAFYDRTAGGGTGSADYCYGVWMKHLTLLRQHGMAELPRTVVELGPGASLGTGYAALLSGAGRYVGLDAVRHAGSTNSAPVYRDLESLFRARAPRPRRGWPDFDALLDARLFPGHILTEAHLERALAPQRVAALPGAMSYGTLADDNRLLRDGEADLVFSHVVLCHVDDPDGFYARCARYLRRGGWMSHETEFSSMGLCREWNGHLQYGERSWKVMAGRRPYFVSRERLSTHLALLAKHGFETRAVLRLTRDDGIERARLAPRWRCVSDEDLSCVSAFIVARKR
jgi:SAM-dependent methyltransferase